MSTTSSGRRASETTAWSGWAAFAGVMMLIIGIIQAIVGFIALFDDTYFKVGNSGLVVSVNYTAWGWVHLFLGAFVALAGSAVLAGKMWGRVVGIILAMLSVIANAAFIAAYPMWSLLIITLDVLVIYALAVHGSELQDV